MKRADMITQGPIFTQIKDKITNKLGELAHTNKTKFLIAGKIIKVIDGVI